MHFRTLKKSEEEGNESMDEDIEKIQHFLGQGQGGLLDQEGPTSLESQLVERGLQNQGGTQDQPSHANELAIKKFNKVGISELFDFKSLFICIFVWF